MVIEEKYSDLAGGYEIHFFEDAPEGFCYHLYDIPCYGGEASYYKAYQTLEDAQEAARSELT